MGGAGVQVFGGIIEVDAAAELEAAGVGAECLHGGLLIAGTEHDDVPAAQVVAPVKFGEPAGGLFGNKICAQRFGIEASADDLFHATFVEVDAGSKHPGLKIGKNEAADKYCSGERSA